MPTDLSWKTLRHSAEYIKFLAAFFNLEELVLLTFLDTVASYTSHLAAASPLVVAWIQWNGYYSRYELSQAGSETWRWDTDVKPLI